MKTDDLPEQIIIEFRQELAEFKIHICELDMPTIDFDSMMDLLISSVMQTKDASFQIGETAIYMSDQDGLFENHEMDHSQKGRVYKAVVNLGNQIKNKLMHLNAYREGQFPYIFRRMLNATDAVLVRQVT